MKCKNNQTCSCREQTVCPASRQVWPTMFDQDRTWTEDLSEPTLTSSSRENVAAKPSPVRSDSSRPMHGSERFQLQTFSVTDLMEVSSRFARVHQLLVFIYIIDSLFYITPWIHWHQSQTSKTTLPVVEFTGEHWFNCSFPLLPKILKTVIKPNRKFRKCSF